MELARRERWILGPSLTVCVAVLIGASILPGGTHGRKVEHLVLFNGTNQTEVNKTASDFNGTNQTSTGRTRRILEWPHEAPPLRIVDLAVRKLGPLLPVPLVLPYCAAWARRQGCPPDLAQGSWISRWRSLCRQDDARVTVLFFAIIILRLVVYVPIKWWGLNEFLSDHVFLVCSLVAQIQITRDAVAAWAAATGYRLLLLVLFFVEVVTTSHNYHTREASWAGYVVGTMLFTGIAFWATREAGGATGEQALLGGGQGDA